MTIIPAIIGIIVKMRKKLVIFDFFAISSIIPPIDAANLLPIAMAKYHIPNINAIILPGTSLLTYDSPTGDKHNSPNV